jgi:hypothetical protein
MKRYILEEIDKESEISGRESRLLKAIDQPQWIDTDEADEACEVCQRTSERPTILRADGARNFVGPCPPKHLSDRLRYLTFTRPVRTLWNRDDRLSSTKALVILPEQHILGLGRLVESIGHRSENDETDLLARAARDYHYKSQNYSLAG